jgi:multidrug efflux pump subunit AcrB
MTMIATIAGAIPLAVATATGSESQNPLGIVLLGGFLMSALLNLFLTPILYMVMPRLADRRAIGCGQSGV